MLKHTLGLEAFAESYRAILQAIRDLARRAVIAPTVVRDALLHRPFALPRELRGAREAGPVADDLRRLEARIGEVPVDRGAVVDRIQAEIRAVLDPHERAESTAVFRGGGPGSAPPPQSAAEPDASPPPSLTPPPAPPPPAKPAGQRAKPPDRGTPVPLAPAAPISRGQRAKPPQRGGPPAPATAAEDSTAPDVSATASRWISAEIDDHDRNQPLALGDTYTIAFGVDVERRANAVGDAGLEEGTVFPEGVSDVELTVELQGTDFDITALKQTFKLQRAGQSKGKARFEITPKHEGRASLTAIIHKERNFVQQMTIMLSVGAANAEPPATTSAARPRSGVAQIQGREVMIVMTPAVPSGYDFMARDARGIKTAHLEVEPDELASAITAARDALLDVVQHADETGEDVFQTRIELAAADTAAALGIMARAGARLFQVLFKHAGGSQDAASIGGWLRDLVSPGTDAMSIQIMSKRAPVPWALLYLGDVSANATLDWQNFLGVRHVIEQLPIVDQLGQGGPAIASDKPCLEVSINLNRRIDDDFRADWVAKQEQFWTDATGVHSRLHVTPRTQRQEFLTALADGTTADQIVYFYGHAESAALGAKGGADASSLVLSDARLTLGDLNTLAPTDIKLRGNPLVFINACESAELSPLFYDGFVPYFMAKGARGVIGTECRTPGIFAAEWAQRFFARFLDGEALGTLTLSLRREFLERHGNPLGLLYAVHCDGDTRVQPGL